MNNKVSPDKFTIQDGVEFSMSSKEITYKGEKVELSFLEACVLEVLCKNINSVVSKKEIFEHSWHGRIVSDNALAKVISTIRYKMKEIGIKNEILTTIPRVGYKLEHYENEQKYSPRKFKKTDAIYFIILSFLIFTSIYNLFFRIDNDINHDFISSEYIVEDIVIKQNKHKVIHRKNIPIPILINDIISRIPSCGIFFYDENGDVVNISFAIKNTPYSFVFLKENYNLAIETITGRISGDRKLCGR